jgi:tungstate transport system permease protein
MTDIFIQAFQKAIELILTGGGDIYGVILRSVYVAGVGTLLACTWSIPIAMIIGLYSFKGKWIVRGIFNALIGVPTVALGLVLVLLFSHQGALGSLHFLFTLNGIMVGEAFLVTPIIVSFTASALSAADIQIRDLARTLGASGLRTDLAVMRETSWSTVLAVTASFNRGFGELGIALLVGGAFVGETNVLTTSIALQEGFANYGLAMAYAIILVVVVLTITLIINLIERLRQEELPFKAWRILGRSGG